MKHLSKDEIRTLLTVAKANNERDSMSSTGSYLVVDDTTASKAVTLAAGL